VRIARSPWSLDRWRTRRRQWVWWVAVVLAACDSYESGRVTAPDDVLVRDMTDSGSATAGTGGSAEDAATRAGAGGAGVTGGAAGGGPAGMDAGDPSEPTACHPNPNTEDQVCPIVCPETCNGMDDDCDLQIDENETQLCGLANATSVCTKAGACSLTGCVGTFRDCDGKTENGCEAAEDDLNHCAGCNTKCSVFHGAAACQDKQCLRTSCDDGYGDCDANELDCESALNTLEHCGDCGIVCADVPNALPSCSAGFCGPGSCDAGFGDCDEVPGNGCEEPLNTLAHCGGCNTPCDFAGAMSDCSTGVCRATDCVGPDHADCDQIAENGCESLDTAQRCGGCNLKCDTSLAHVTAASCDNPACSIECEAGWGDCDGDPQTGCETELNSLTHCGQCHQACSAANAVSDCSGGTCTLVGCVSALFDDCDDDDGDGCETRLDSNEDCGACDAMCTGGKTCSGGTCSSIDCNAAPQSTADCGSPGVKCANCDANGGDCETDIGQDLTNCGACGNACVFTDPSAADPTATLTCSAQGCKAECKPGYGDCNGDYRDGCEQQLNTLGNCDACGEPCAIRDAISTCARFSDGHFVCEVASCATDYADCDGDLISCEASLGTPTSCGDCDTVCSLSRASEACTGGTGNWTCTIAACDQPHFKDCNDQDPDGCEVDSRTSVANCGSCGNDCRTHANVASASCIASACDYTCDPGHLSCDAVLPGCETDVRTLSDCGGCGTSCARNNGSASCATGSCELVGCDSGFLECDGDEDNGCEPLSTLIDCGACGVPCNLPNATSSCATQSCAISICNPGWADCDQAAANGCERDTRAPSAGGLGPCAPDANCTRLTRSGHEYFFCGTPRTWDDASLLCQSQLSGNLVHIDDDTENEFVRTHVGDNVWIGATDDPNEGVWRWSDSNQQFWMGAAAGSVVGMGYNKWAAGEPNDSGGIQDCATMWETATVGSWDDDDCAALKPFVCEIPGDLCPSDDTKTDPQQCGCGNPDVDADGDGTSSCAGQNDQCDDDPAKVVPGQCGCGASDADSDNDAVANCLDACPNDATKTTSGGSCGCGVPDSDSDSDGTVDCMEACDYDGTRTELPCSLSFPPSNVTVPDLFANAPDVTAGCGGTLSFNTSSAAAVSICGTSITPITQAQAGGPELWILPMNSLTVSGTVLRFTGARPVVLAVANDATIHATIDVGAQGTTAGAGGDVSCVVGTGQGANGVHDTTGDDGSGGGGGGGFGTVGGAGGSGNAGGAGGGAGAVSGGATLVPLRGGCRGGSSNTAAGGAGGGAVQILVGGRLTLGASAVVAASGGGGSKGTAEEDGGGGGGSGGSVFLQALQLSVDANAWITANGGGGAGGIPTNNTNGSPGTDGLKNNTSRAPGGAGGNADGGNDSDGGNGGPGAAQAGAASVGANAPDRSCTLLLFCGAQGGGGGGGGGGAGRISVRGIQAGCSVPTAKISPTTVPSCG
jgi:Lectin C-type domain